MSDICKIPQSFVDTIKQGELTSLAKDYAELGIDAFMKDGLGKDIPVVSSIVALIKTTNNISTFLLLKKIIAFLNGIAGIPFETRNKMIEKIDSSSKYKKKVGEQLLFIIDHCEDDVKADYIARLFKSFLEDKINYNDFVKGSSIINKLTTEDFDRFINHKVIMIEDSDFIGVGLAFSYTTQTEVVNTIEGDWDDRQKFSSYGGETEIELTSIGEILRQVFKTEYNNE